MILAGLTVLAVTTAQAGDRLSGLAVYAARCASCHSATVNDIGPWHQGMLGRTVGKVPDFDYSPALRASALVWTRERLLAWLTNPEAVIPGQAMDFTLDDPRERQAVVTYLATLTAPISTQPAARSTSGPSAKAPPTAEAAQ